MSSSNQPPRTSGSIEHYDAVIIGAGVSGMYALHHLREMGFSVRVYDGASDVGGTWWYNRYPGARVDGPGSPFYCYTFSDELMTEWDWAETQSGIRRARLPEHVADRSTSAATSSSRPGCKTPATTKRRSAGRWRPAPACAPLPSS
jgi:cation diffusion facilitator CzcD-associated flavoprotein CzcO